MNDSNHRLLVAEDSEIEVAWPTKDKSWFKNKFKYRGLLKEGLPEG